MRQRTLTEYRNIDLGLFALMLAVFEFIIVRVSRSALFEEQGYTVSLAAAITAIVYMRWGLWGGLHAGLAGILFCLFSGATAGQYMIYTLGNLLSLPAAVLLKKIGYEKVRTDRFLGMLFPLIVLWLMQGGRAVVTLLLGGSFANAMGFFTTDSLSALFTFVILWIVRRLDGVYENQRHYLLRIQNNSKGDEVR